MIEKNLERHDHSLQNCCELSFYRGYDRKSVWRCSYKNWQETLIKQVSNWGDASPDGALSVARMQAR